MSHYYACRGCNASSSTSKLLMAVALLPDSLRISSHEPAQNLSMNAATNTNEAMTVRPHLAPIPCSTNMANRRGGSHDFDSMQWLMSER